MTLTGLGRPSTDEGAAVDLETHIADVLAVVDSVTVPGAGEPGGEIVLVGHDYGIHPVLGAADRRARSIARIVYLDSGMPQDGVPALAAVPDQLLREEVAERAAGFGDGVTGDELPPPARDAWPRWEAPRASPRRRSTASPLSRRRSRWAHCSNRSGSPAPWPRCRRRGCCAPATDRAWRCSRSWWTSALPPCERSPKPG
ncbi:alpha/beta fold hydrolase [Streptomyces sp. S063]|uniref:alpha/beta fold hydrolase n=1 Tax=Streptomyces sp. S063 TaxID=2005885 RepID=UPI0013E3E054